MSLNVRRLEPEWLDELPANAPEAEHSRKDLQRINALMGNARWLARLSTEMKLSCPATLVELATGDGMLLLRLLERMNWKPERLLLVDRQPVVTTANLTSLQRFAGHVEVITADAFEWLASDRAPSADLIMANLFLHHFNDAELKNLLRLAGAKCDAFIACEPERSVFASFNTRLLALIGCNHVTRHDALISVQAGFRDRELETLWPQDGGWSTFEAQSGLFSHYFGARRNVAK